MEKFLTLPGNGGFLCQVLFNSGSRNKGKEHFNCKEDLCLYRSLLRKINRYFLENEDSSHYNIIWYSVIKKLYNIFMKTTIKAVMYIPFRWTFVSSETSDILLSL